MPSMGNSFTILDMTGPFREPREEIFSYDYSIQRSTWPTPHGVRVKISIPNELDVFKKSLLQETTGSPGQQLIVSNMLSKKIADWKMQIAETEGFLRDRRDVMLDPFVGPLAYLFPKLERLFQGEQILIREDVKRRVGI